jgi:hypothetical protein
MRTMSVSLKLFPLVMLMTLLACKGQNHRSEKFKPDVRINVDKEYDKDNKVIRYDSSYSYSFSGDHVPDSILRKFMLPRKDLGFTNKYFDDFFRSDSLLRFFGNDVNWIFRNEGYFNDMIFKDLENLNRPKLLRFSRSLKIISLK